MPLQDLTKPPKGAKYRLLTPDQFGFGKKVTSSVVIVDWVLKDKGEFEPIKITRRETRMRYGIFENYMWEEQPVKEETVMAEKS